MNEELIMKMSEASVKNGILTYALFDRIFGMLSRREQYQVCEILNKNNIQLEDTYDSNDYSASSTEILEGNNPDIDLEEDQDLFLMRVFLKTQRALKNTFSSRIQLNKQTIHYYGWLKKEIDRRGRTCVSKTKDLCGNMQMVIIVILEAELDDLKIIRYSVNFVQKEAETSAENDVPKEKESVIDRLHEKQVFINERDRQKRQGKTQSLQK